MGQYWCPTWGAYDKFEVFNFFVCVCGCWNVLVSHFSAYNNPETFFSCNGVKKVILQENCISTGSAFRALQFQTEYTARQDWKRSIYP